MARRITKLSDLVIEHLWQALCEEAHYCVMAGSRSSGKTYAVAQYVVHKLMTTPNISALVIRENFTNLRGSIYEDFKQVLEGFEITEKTTKSLVPLEITLPNGNHIVFRGIDNPDKIKGLKKAGKKFHYLIVEEAQNIPDYETVLKTEFTAFRGQKERHTIIIMNTDIKNWVYETFYEPEGFDPDEYTLETKGYQVKVIKKPKEKVVLIYTSIFGNKFLTKEDKEVFENLKSRNIVRYKIDALGIWGRAGGAIYAGYAERIRPCEITDEVLESIGEWTFGVDYGEVNSATVAFLIGVTKDYKRVYYIDMYYWNNNNKAKMYKDIESMTNDVVLFIKNMVIKYGISYFLVIVDSAAKMFRIQIHSRLDKIGLKNFDCILTHTQNNVAGKFPVLERIQLHKELMAQDRIFFNTQGNFAPHFKELQLAVWDENKEKLTRLDKNNDTLDAVEYALISRYHTLSSVGK